MMGLFERYKDLLPLTSQTPHVSLGEGSTPFLPLRHIGKKLEINLYGKVEGANPTGSFKDRGMVLAAAKALESGASAVICASTGNTSASAAAYSAAAGIPCYVLLPAGKVARGKLAQALIYGAKVLAVHGNFDRALELARAASDELGLAIVNSVNPYRLWGQRSGAWEICDQLLDAPDWCVLPVGNAGNITAYWAGFLQYHKMKKCKRRPKMVGVQAEGASPLVTGVKCDSPETVATAIRIGRPVNANKARAAVKMSGGFFMSVSDEEILEAQGFLASGEGIFAEPASCATLAGLFKLKERGELPKAITVAAILTGNGLKDPNAAISKVGEPVEIDGTIEALKEAMKL